MSKFLGFVVLGSILIFLNGPAEAWDADTDALIICNKNSSHDINVAYAVKAVPWGIAALIGAGWHRGGWWTVKAGKCELTMPLKDVQNYEIWLYVEVVQGEQIQWKHYMNDRFCIDVKDSFEAFSWVKKEIQSCREGEQPATFSYMTSLYNLNDQHSIYNFENRTIDLNFTYDQPSGQAKPAIKQTEPRRAPKARQEPKQEANAAKAPVIPPSPAMQNLVQICTPLITQQNGNFIPAAKKAIDNGDMQRHFSRIDEIINAMKDDKSSQLNQLAKAAHVQLIVSPYDETQKTVRLFAVNEINDLRCQAGYRQAQYHAAEWLKRPNLSPPGLQSR